MQLQRVLVALLLLLLLRKLDVWLSQSIGGQTDVSAVALVHPHSECNELSSGRASNQYLPARRFLFKLHPVFLVFTTSPQTKEDHHAEFADSTSPPWSAGRRIAARWLATRCFAAAWFAATS